MGPAIAATVIRISHPAFLERMKTISHLALGLTLLLPFAARADVDADLQTAFGSLVSGRSYKKDFPSIKTRNMLVADFLGTTTFAKAPLLRGARDQAIAIRQGSAAGPTQKTAAQIIAWEGLESLTEGYLFAGNKDLLTAVRVAYPGGAGGSDDRPLPAELTTEYLGTSIKQLTYARNYFLQPVKDVLVFMSRDSTGEVRAQDNDFPMLPHYTRFDDAASLGLPHAVFNDPNFSDPVGQASQTLARLYGSALERLGMATSASADQLWRGAYGDKNRPAAQRDAMLAEAVEGLKSDIHAQFLASLPMAAALDDGSNGQNEYQLALMDQVRVTTTSAQRLRQRILEGEKPTAPALVSSWTPSVIQNQITTVQQAYNNALAKYAGGGQGTVLFEMARTEEAQAQNFGRAATLRGQYESRLLAITRIDPSAGAYNGLQTQENRKSYIAAVKAKFDALVDGANTQAGGFGDGSEMSGAALRLVQALQEVKAANFRIKGYPQRMRIELERNNDVNATITQGTQVIAAMDAAIAIASMVETTVYAAGMTSGTSIKINLGQQLAANLAPVKALRQASDTVTINSLNSNATIRNLLIEQQEQIEALPILVTGVDIARNELLRLFSEAERLIEDHIFYQVGANELWYADPGLAFRLEAAEEEYQTLLQQFRIELYKLGRMLEFAWNERFTNPVKDSQGNIVPGSALPATADNFTEAESVFYARDHLVGKDFYTTLKDWDAKLRDSQFRGPYSAALQDVNTFTAFPISLRQDIFGLIDYAYDPGSNTYQLDQERRKKNIQEFRAYLLRVAAQDPANTPTLTKLRLEFPFTYARARLIPGQPTAIPIVQRNIGLSGYDQFYNHRLKQIAIRIRGTNVFAVGSGTVPVNIEYFGNLTRSGFFADSLYTQTRTTSTFQVPLYQRDPEQRLAQEPFFGTGVAPINAAIGTTSPALQAVNDWPLFCDRVIFSLSGPLMSNARLENIEDIEFTMKMEVGPPQQPSWPAF